MSSVLSDFGDLHHTENAVFCHQICARVFNYYSVIHNVGGKKLHIDGRDASNQSGLVFHFIAFRRMIILNSLIFYCCFVTVAERNFFSCVFRWCLFLFFPAFASIQKNPKLSVKVDKTSDSFIKIYIKAVDGIKITGLKQEAHINNPEWSNALETACLMLGTQSSWLAGWTDWMYVSIHCVYVYKLTQF